MEHYWKDFEGKKMFSYYDFLVGVCSIPINYKDLDIMENLIALYSIKNRTQLLKVKFSEYASRYS